MTLKHFPWVYYMIICHVGPSWGHSGIDGGLILAQNSTNNGPSWPKTAFHDQKRPFMAQIVLVWPQNGLKTFPMWILHDVVSCCTTLGPFQRSTGAIWKRPQGGPICHIIMCYAPEKCFRVILGHAGTFWVMKGHFGSWRLFIEASFRVIKGHFGP